MTVYINKTKRILLSVKAEKRVRLMRQMISDARTLRYVASSGYGSAGGENYYLTKNRFRQSHLFVYEGQVGRFWKDFVRFGNRYW